MDKRTNNTTCRHFLSTFTYPCFFKLYQLFYVNEKRTLTVNNLSHLDLLGLAVIIMLSGYRIEMMRRLSYLPSRRRVMPGYIDGLVINFGNEYTREERELLKDRLTALGITVS